MSVRRKMNMPLIEHIKKNHRGSPPGLSSQSISALTLVRKRGLDFNAALQDTTAMTEPALMSYELGFKSLVLQFDMNVEAEILINKSNDYLLANLEIPQVGSIWLRNASNFPLIIISYFVKRQKTCN